MLVGRRSLKKKKDGPILNFLLAPAVGYSRPSTDLPHQEHHRMRSNAAAGARGPRPSSVVCLLFFSRRRRHTRCLSDWSSDVCSSDLYTNRYATSVTAPMAALNRLTIA